MSQPCSACCSKQDTMEMQATSCTSWSDSRIFVGLRVPEILQGSICRSSPMLFCPYRQNWLMHRTYDTPMQEGPDELRTSIRYRSTFHSRSCPGCVAVVRGGCSCGSSIGVSASANWSGGVKCTCESTRPKSGS